VGDCDHSVRHGVEHVPLEAVQNWFCEMTLGTCFPEAGDAELRSQREPLGIALPHGEACAILEDTRRAKRLFARDGCEIVSAHLSRFAFRSPADGARLIRGALEECRRRQMTAAFVAAAPGHVTALLQALGIPPTVDTTVSVFGYGFPAGLPWYVDTSEI
jgi:hypothetical protein